MATVTNFESLSHPSKSELRQFAELFTPLFQASSDEAKRQAVAALSQCPHVPPAVALFIGCQPIGIAAPFLASSQVIDDDTLITIARTQGAAHAKAIVRREALSPKVVDALVGLRQVEPSRAIPVQDMLVEPVVLAPNAAEEEARAAEADEAERLAREEALRREIKHIAKHFAHDETDRLGLRSLSPMQEALLVRFAREREAIQFAATLADALSASRWLAERIMLDLSGQQLAVTLTSVGMNFVDAVFVLENFYPHLAEMQGSVTRAWRVLDDIDPEESDARVEAWRRADNYTYLPPEQPAVRAPSNQPGSFGTEARPVRQIPPARDMRTLSRGFVRSR